MVRVADRNGVRLLVGHSQSLDSGILKMVEVIRSGVLGRPIMIASSYYNEWLYRPRSRDEPGAAPGYGSARYHANAGGRHGVQRPRHTMPPDRAAILPLHPGATCRGGVNARTAFTTRRPGARARVRVNGTVTRAPGGSGNISRSSNTRPRRSGASACARSADILPNKSHGQKIRKS